MDFNSLTVKQLLENEKLKAVIEEYAPEALKLPLKLFQNKNISELLEMVQSKGLLPEGLLDTIVDKLKDVLDKE